jgi:hypothetical protein
VPNQGAEFVIASRMVTGNKNLVDSYYEKIFNQVVLPQAQSPDGPSDPTPPSGPTPSDPSPPPPSGGQCTKHGDCNPESDGSGMICKAGVCVPGCTDNWQCPGSTTCVSGQCR